MEEMSAEMEQVGPMENERTIEAKILARDPQTLVDIARGMIENGKIQELAKYDAIRGERTTLEGRDRYPEEPVKPVSQEEEKNYRSAMDFTVRALSREYPELFGRKEKYVSIDDGIEKLRNGLKGLGLLVELAQSGKDEASQG